MAVFTNTSAKSIETRNGTPKHRSVWLSYLNFSIYTTSVGLVLSYTVHVLFGYCISEHCHSYF